MILARSLARIVIGLSLAGALGVFGPVAARAAIAASHEKKPLPTPSPSATPQAKADAVPADRLSIDDGKSWIAVETFSFSNGAGSAASRGTAKATHRPVEVTVPANASTAALAAALAKNPLFPSVRLLVHSADYAFKNVVFSKMAESTGPGGGRLRELTFVYQTVTYTITPGGKSASDDWSQ
jgi:type VI protein secretion system component Hcp